MTTPGSFGTGLRIDDGDLVFEGGQLVEVTGVANLVQALTIRVLTPLGSDRFDTSYGLDVTQVFTQPNGVRMVKELLKLNLISTLLSDPRVSEVRQVTFDEDNGLTPEVIAAHHRRVWTVQAELETANGTPVTLPVNVEV
jgi:hypothetical protein